MKAYKFLKDNMESANGNEPAWVVGETRTIDGELVMCSRGYHSSKSWYDALNYAQGNVAAIVEVSKPVDKQDDKQVSSSCTVVKMVSIEKVLRAWGCDCAERALKRAGVTDKRSWDAIKIARLYNMGEVTKEELVAAGYAARAAAGYAARAAAWDAEIQWQKRHLNKLIKQAFEVVK